MSVDFSSCPEFKNVVDSSGGVEEGGVKKALDFLIQVTEQGIKEKSQIDIYIANIFRYYSLSKNALLPDQQIEIENKIKALSARITPKFTPSDTPGSKGSFLSWFNPFSYFSRSQTSPVKGVTPIEAAPKKVEPLSPETVIPAKEEAEVVIDEGLQGDIERQIKATQSSLKDLEDLFKDIEQALLDSKDYGTLIYQIELIKKPLETYKTSFETLNELSKSLHIDVKDQLDIFNLALKQFSSYIKSIEDSIELQNSELSSFGSQKQPAKVPDKPVARYQSSVPSAAIPGVGFFCDTGLPNLGVTCYVNTFLKTCLPYFDLLKGKKLEGELKKLRDSLVGLADELRSPRPNKKRINELLLSFVKNPLLEREIPKIEYLGAVHYCMGDSRALATKVFALLDIDQDPTISIVRGSLIEEIGGLEEIGGQRKSLQVGGREPSISISGGTSIQQMIDNYSNPGIIDWTPGGDGTEPVIAQKRDFLVAEDGIPQRLMFTITQQAASEVDPSVTENKPLQPLTEINETVYVPIHDSTGKLLGKMEMQLEAIASNSPNAHFLGYVRSSDGSWTEHNDSIVTHGFTHEQISFFTGMNASIFGCQFNYVTTGFIPE